MWKMSDFLKNCSTERAYKFEMHKAQLQPEVVQPIEGLRKKLKLRSALLEQLDSVTAGQDQETKFSMALEFIRAARISQQQLATVAAAADGGTREPLPAAEDLSYFL
eukprot:GHRR01012836.1.p1 GENE.GHRR01012836.1~~GHRR01012836.1.p1  ORF type:complete len:107 (+),score=40.06 GHRR01012836.1:736-1056(+)